MIRGRSMPSGIPTGSPDNGYTGGFGELIADPKSPSCQVDFVYGLPDQLVITYANGTGASATAADRMAVVSSGTAVLGTASIQTKRIMRYRPGQSCEAYFTALFGTPAAYQLQLARVGNATSGYYWGYYDVSGSVPALGVVHVYGGAVQIAKLTVTGAASAGNVTVTLNGQTKVVTIVTGGTTAITAAELAAADYTATGNGWFASAVGSDVFFVAARNGAQSGSYSVSGSSIAGSFVQTQTGAANTIDFTPCSSFNEWNPTSSSAFDPAKGNIYRISYTYLGFGPARFYVADPDTGEMRLAHTILNVSRRTSTVLPNPGLSIRWIASNAGATTSVSVKGASGAGFIVGKRSNLESYSYSFSKDGLTSGEKYIGSIRVRREFAGTDHRGQIELHGVSVGYNSATKPGTIKMYLNATLTSPAFAYVDQTNSVALYDTAATAISGGRLLEAIALSKDGSAMTEFDDVVLGPGDTISFTSTSTATNDVDVSLVWHEEP